MKLAFGTVINKYKIPLTRAQIDCRDKYMSSFGSEYANLPSVLTLLKTQPQ
jgi:hypothetical protein